MKEFSIITCVNDYQVYRSCLLDSIPFRGNHSTEFIAIGNHGNRHPIPGMLNQAMKSASGKYLIVCHQDVRLVGEDWFDSVTATLESLPNHWAVCGVAGISQGREIGMVLDHEGRKVWDGDDGPAKVDAADDVLLILNAAAGLQYTTDLEGPHGHASNLCLAAQLYGYSVWAAKIPIVHDTRHSRSLIVDPHLFKSVLSLHRLWRETFPKVTLPYAYWDETTIGINLRAEIRTGRAVCTVHREEVVL